MDVLETSQHKERQRNNSESVADEPLIAAQQGEPSEIIYFTSILLNNERTRTILYLVLILMWIFPLLLQTMDVLKQNYHSNTFCSTEDLCIVSFIGFCIVFIGAIIGFMVVFVIKNKKYLNIIYCICFIIGFLILFIIMVIISADYKDKFDQPDTICFQIPQLFDDTNVEDFDTKDFCRISYFGNNSVGLMMILNGILDKIFSDHISVRIGCFTIGLFVSSVCIVINLIANKTYYADENGFILTITSYWFCITGYCIISIICIIIILLKVHYAALWRRKPRNMRWIGIIGWIFLTALFFIQIRRYTDTVAFTVVGLILSVDLQVMVQQ